MNDTMIHELERSTGERLRRGEVVDITESDTVIVALEGHPTPLRCDLLVTTEGPAPVLVPGDQVLTWLAGDGLRAVIVGRIGPTRGVAPTPPTPDTLTLEAARSLTLRVGEGSITIREDGKILIKGKDLVSHAQRMNRIKGGAVSIN